MPGVGAGGGRDRDRSGAGARGGRRGPGTGVCGERRGGHVLRVGRRQCRQCPGLRHRQEGQSDHRVERRRLRDLRGQAAGQDQQLLRRRGAAAGCRERRTHVAGRLLAAGEAGDAGIKTKTL